jgi:hypothetical protein
VTIQKTGELVEYIMAAVQQHGATPHTDIFVRIGELGPVYRIAGLTGQADQRGMRLILQTEVVYWET